MDGGVTAMKMLRRWAFVNLAAAIALIVAAIAGQVPAKLAAEPDLIGLLTVPMLIAAAVWLALALIRHWSLTPA